jgi:cysteinyl-tRNA synthetase
VEARIADRAAARKAKDFARGDAIRDELLRRGVALLDGPEGTSWDVE